MVVVLKPSICVTPSTCLITCSSSSVTGGLTKILIIAGLLPPDVLHARDDQVARADDHADRRRADADDQHHLQGTAFIAPEIADRILDTKERPFSDALFE